MSLGQRFHSIVFALHSYFVTIFYFIIYVAILLSIMYVAFEIIIGINIHHIFLHCRGFYVDHNNEQRQEQHRNNDDIKIQSDQLNNSIGYHRPILNNSYFKTNFNDLNQTWTPENEPIVKRKQNIKRVTMTQMTRII